MSQIALNFYIYTEYVLESSVYKSILDDEAKHYCNRRYPSVAVKKIIYSSFRHLYLSRNDQALLNCTDYDHRTLAVIVRKFHPYYAYYTFDEEIGMIHPKIFCQDNTPYERAWDMCGVGCLGLIRMWYRARGSYARGLAMVFGQMSTPMYR